MNRRLLLFSLCQAAFSGYGDILANTLNLMNLPVRNLFEQSLALNYGVTSSAVLETIFSLAASCEMVGLLLGFSVMGNLMDMLGRKETSVILRSALGTLSALLMLLAHYTNRFEFFVAAHLLAGVLLSLKVLLIIYIAECSPDHNRGTTTMLVNSGASLAVCAVTPLCLPAALGTDAHWTVLPLISLALATLHLITGLFFPQSPKQLYIQMKDEVAAEKALFFFHGDCVDLKAVFSEYNKETQFERHGHASVSHVLRKKTHRWSLWLVLLLSLVPPISALNIKSQYLSQIFLSYGLDQSQVTYTLLGMSATLLPLLFVSPLLIDSFGRRPLFIAVCFLCSAEWLGLGCAQVFVDGGQQSLVASVLGVGGACLGQAAQNLGLLVMAPILLADICPHNTRAAIAQVSQVLPMLLAVVQVALFPLLLSLLGSVFFFFSALLALLLSVLVFLQLPETRSLPVERLVRRLSHAPDGHFLHPHYGSTQESPSTSSFETETDADEKAHILVF